MFNHVLHLSLQQFLYACGSARDKSVCVRRLSTETAEVRMYSYRLPMYLHGLIFLGIYACNLLCILSECGIDIYFHASNNW